MRLIRAILICLFLAGTSLMAASEAGGPVLREAKPGENAVEAKGEHEEGLTLHPIKIFDIGPLPVTNSMLVTWIVALALIGFAQFATRNIKDVPEGAQNFW